MLRYLGWKDDTETNHFWTADQRIEGDPAGAGIISQIIAIFFEGGFTTKIRRKYMVIGERSACIDT